jgi:hypothetical protein
MKSKKHIIKNKKALKIKDSSAKSNVKTIKTDNGYGDPLNIKLQLNSLKNSRNSMARIMRLYADGTISHIQFRNLIYSFSHFITFWKIDIEDEIQKLWSVVHEFENKQT